MTCAEKRFRKLKMGGVPWTPKLTYLRLSIEEWMMVIKRNRQCKVSTRTIIRKKAKENMGNTNTEVPDEIAKQKIDLLFIEYKDYLLEATDLRKNFQHKLATARSIERNKKVAKEIDRMERIGAQRLSAARIRQMNGTSRTARRLTQVIAPNEQGEWTEI